MCHDNKGGMILAGELQKEFKPLNVAVLVVSDTRTEKTDKSGRLLAERLEGAGHRLLEKKIVDDDIYRIRAAVANWCIDDRVEIILTTGGTGVTGRDGTPEALGPLFDKTLEGFGEVFRVISFEEIGSSGLQSRALAGLINGRYVFCLPGSASACATAWDRLIASMLDCRTRPCNLAELMPRLNEREP